MLVEYYCDSNGAKASTEYDCRANGGCCVNGEFVTGEGELELTLPDECPAGQGYVTIFGNSETLEISALAEVSGTVPSSCEITVTMDGGDLSSGAASHTCRGTASCAASFTISKARIGKRLASERTVSFSASVANCCGIGSSDSTTLVVRADPERRLYSFLGAGEGNGLRYVGTPPGIDRVVQFLSTDRDKSAEIAEWGTTELLQSSSAAEGCQAYPAVNIFGYSNGGHAALNTSRLLAQVQHVTVNRLFIADPVPWLDCSLTQRCSFGTRQCVNNFDGVYQELDTASLFNATRRGRPVGNGSERIELGANCGDSDATWPDQAHVAILCQPGVVSAIMQMFGEDIEFITADFYCGDLAPADMENGYGLANCAYPLGLYAACYHPLP